MILLNYGCSCSELKVLPRNWKKTTSTKAPWEIYYRFYDPKFRDDPKYTKGKQVRVSGMNEFKDVHERREATRAIIEHELHRLRELNYNPITGTIDAWDQPEEIFEITAQTPFNQALRKALELTDCTRLTMIDMRSVVKNVCKAAEQLRFDEKPVSEITLKYLKRILEQLKKNLPKWSNRRHNMYRAYLMKLYKEQFIQMEAVEANYPRDLIIKKVLKKERVTLTPEERVIINETLKRERYSFWRALHIFYKSGARETELFKVQARDVDLDNQTVRYTILKGRHREIRRPIQDNILPLWQEVMKDCKKPTDYVFSRGLVPGPVAIRPDQLTRRWHKYVKAPKIEGTKKRKDQYMGGLGINSDLYALKHLHTTETIDELEKIQNTGDATKEITNLTGHTSSAMVIEIYDQKAKSRKWDKLKRLENTL